MSVSASRDSLGAVHISLVNLDPVKTVTVRTALDCLPSGKITGQILTSERYTDVNRFSQPEKVKVAGFKGARKEGGEPVGRVPPMAVVVVEL